MVNDTVLGRQGIAASQLFPAGEVLIGRQRMVMRALRTHAQPDKVSVNRVKHTHRGQQIKELRLHGWLSNNHFPIRSFDPALKGLGLHAGGLASRLTH
jgi:hypothetical protein